MDKNHKKFADDALAIMMIVLPGFFIVHRLSLTIAKHEIVALSVAVVATVFATVVVSSLRNNLYLAVLVLITYCNIMLNVILSKLTHGPLAFSLIGAITGCCLGVCLLVSTWLMRRYNIRPAVANLGVLIICGTAYLSTGFGILSTAVS